MAALTTTRQPAIWYGSRARSYLRLGVPNHGFCAGLPRAETVVPHRDPGRIFTGRGIRDAPKRAWPSIGKVPIEGSLIDTATDSSRQACSENGDRLRLGQTWPLDPHLSRL